MSSAGKWFKNAIAQDTSFRQAQNRPLFFSGTNRNPQGSIPAGLDIKKQSNQPVEAPVFVAGHSVVGGEEVAG